MYLTWEVCQRRGGLELRVGALGIELEGKLLERLELLHEELLLVRINLRADLRGRGASTVAAPDVLILGKKQVSRLGSKRSAHAEDFDG